VTGRRKKLRRIVAGIAVVVVVAAGAPFVYIHFIEGSAPAKLSLPGGGATNDASTSVASVSGDWQVGPGSVVGYRVEEELLGQSSTAVGRTSEVWGGLTITGTSVTSGAFTVNMASVVSDQSQRNSQFDGRIMDVTAFPTATFKLTAPIPLGTYPPAGTVKNFSATGDLTMRGVTKEITITVSAERVGSSLYVLSDVPITFADWNIANPSIGGFVTTQNTGTLEILLNLTTGAGNQPSTGSGANSNSGPGGPVTVPATTVPPLTVPAR
jgi:polyisoprenoid-binding protein YceI